MHERMKHLMELLRFSTESTFIIPATLFNEDADPANRFSKIREAYKKLQDDDELSIFAAERGENLEITIIRKQD